MFLESSLLFALLSVYSYKLNEILNKLVSKRDKDLAENFRNVELTEEERMQYGMPNASNF
jgi:hypothetical protein